jgi:hypothetical protein
MNTRTNIYIQRHQKFTQKKYTHYHSNSHKHHPIHSCESTNCEIVVFFLLSECFLLCVCFVPQGKVLLIDEAYNLDDRMYGKQALDTIVELVSGAPGEDIALVMAGDVVDSVDGGGWRECGWLWCLFSILDFD